MTFKKALLFGVISVKGFLCNKKLIAFFIFLSLSVNGFAPSAAEINKYSFVMVAFKVAQNAVVQIFEKCNLSLDSMANEFYSNVSSALAGTPLDKQSAKQENKGNTPVSAGTSINISQIIFNEKVKILKDGDSFFAYHGNSVINKAERTYGKALDFALMGIVLLFLMFIAGIVRRKEIDGNIIKNIKILKKEFSV